tara:strand:- start:440 stop:610 length:171 start_codon:yes stop_codon:yes gene_type:complete
MPALFTRISTFSKSFVTFSIKFKDSEKFAAFDLYPLQAMLEFENFSSSFLASLLLE